MLYQLQSYPKFSKEYTALSSGSYGWVPAPHSFGSVLETNEIISARCQSFYLKNKISPEYD